MKSLVQTITAINASADIESQAKDEDGRPVLTETQAYLLKSKFDTFETVLAAELGTLDAYFVSQKLAYETRVLIEQADKLIPESLRSELPQETTNDLRQAGRCIAFDIPTAAGFHIIRAVESVIRKYYNAVVGNVPKPKMRNWGAYIKNLAAAGADTRITGFLDHIRENHRNPILHPEETLSAEDSQVLLGTAISTIVQMMLEIRKITQMKEITDEDIPF